MGYVDVDGDAATVNSSTATLSLPAGATVTWAGLYWGADTALGTGGSAAPNAANRGIVRFKVGSGGYQTVAAAPADVLTSTGKDTRYRAFADVTALLPAAGNATYTVGNVQTGRGDDRFAGWSLVVAYQDATQGVHRVSVYDGLGTVDATHTFSTDITPFFTPASGPVATKTGLLAFEGDTGIVGETATFNGTALTDAINGLGNLMNSTMAVDGTLFGAKDPNYGNLMGTDIDVWNKHGLPRPRAELGDARVRVEPGPVRAVRAVARLRRGPGREQRGPTVGGVARDGSTLTADPGTWNGTPTITYEYQWQRCDAGGASCADIPGATGSTYTLTPADVGSTVRVLVTAVNGAGSSAPTASAADRHRRPARPLQRHRPAAERPRARRPDPDHHARGLERHRPGLRRPVAALRHRRRQLHRHRGRDRVELRADGRRHRRDRAQRGHGLQRRRRRDRVLGAHDHRRPRPAGQHDAPVDHRRWRRTGRS